MTTTEANEPREYKHRATYCPEDNKLRFYPSTNSLGDWDDPDFDKEDIKAAGFRWASKQECYVCPRWTPAAEDAAMDFAPTIEDETYSPAERSADRAERFQGYREKRRNDAHGYADRMGAGVVGFQDRRRADRAARKRDRLAGNSLTMWDRAEYWHSRTSGVISHAIGRENPATRRTRIKKLEADQRKQTKSLNERAERLNGWAKVAGMEGAEVLLPVTEGGYGITDEANEAGRLAYALANDGGYASRAILKHPRDEAANDYAAELHGEYHRGFSPYDLLTNDTYAAYGDIERLTPGEVARVYLETMGNPEDADDYGQRWAAHYAFRLEFERAMLAEEGGAADDAEMIPGGFILGGSPTYCIEHAPKGWNQIIRVNKSPATKKVTSVKVWGTFHANGCDVVTRLVTIKVERFAANRYRPPTAEELDTFKKEQAEARKAQKKNAPKKPALVNPTDNDAEALHALWNERARQNHARAVKAGQTYGEFDGEQTVARITQAKYSAVSKGNYARCETRTLHDGGYLSRQSSNMYSRSGKEYDDAIGDAACKIRVATVSGWYDPDRVIVLTDKPQKPLPIDWDANPFAPKEAEAVTPVS